MGRNRWMTVFSVLFLLVLGAAGCRNPGPEMRPSPRPDAPMAPTATVLPAASSNGYVLCVGDTLNVAVFNHGDLSMRTLVPPSGIITFPFLGDLQASGRTISQLRDAIQQGLAKGYVPNPQVSVNVEAIAGGRVYVLGEVKAPTVVSVKDEMHAIEAISLAGGFTTDANPSAVLLIRRQADGRSVMDALDLKSFLTGRGQGGNQILQHGDIVYVPPSAVANVDRFFMHLRNVLDPIRADIMEGIILAPRVNAALKGGKTAAQIQ